MKFPYVKRSTHDAVVAERDALRAKLERYTRGLAQGAAASAAKRRQPKFVTDAGGNIVA